MVKPIFQIKKEKETPDYGLFTIEPLEQGYGNTLGVALRRVLLTSLSGAAITQIKIDGVKHKFSTLEGMKEDVIELILNLKQVRLSYGGEKPVKLNLEKLGPGEVKAGDIKTSGQVEIVNRDLVLCRLTAKKKLKIELAAESGYGYVPAEERESGKIGVIPIDAVFSPVQRVNYKVEATRVGRRTDLDRLVLEITTDGTVRPSKALKESARILIDFFTQVVKPKKMPVKEKVEMLSSETLRLTFEEVDVPTRIANALRKGGFETVGDLAAATDSDLAKVKNLGEKSVGVIKAALSKKGLTLKGEKK